MAWQFDQVVEVRAARAATKIRKRMRHIRAFCIAKFRIASQLARNPLIWIKFSFRRDKKEPNDRNLLWRYPRRYHHVSTMADLSATNW
jgi:hypothetical protein